MHTNTLTNTLQALKMRIC